MSDPQDKGAPYDDATIEYGVLLTHLFRKKAIWALCPYGKWTEADDSIVIFDRRYRPICRIKSDGQKEIVPSDEYINFCTQRWFHRGIATYPDQETRKTISDLIEKYVIATELRRRWERLQSGDLLRWGNQA